MAGSLNQQTYDRFKKEILTLSLKPGEAVSAQKLAERYGVSRTPAREALVRLQNEGLVVIRPQSQSVIACVDVDRVSQEWYVRRSLELGLVDEFIAKVTPKDIQRMKECTDRLEELGGNPRTPELSYEYLRWDERFHEVPYQVTGQELAAEIVMMSLPNYRRLRLLVDLDNVFKDRTVEEHRELTSLAEKKDLEGYRRFLTAHIGHIFADADEMKERFPAMFISNGEEKSD